MNIQLTPLSTQTLIFLRDRILPSLTAQQKKVLMVATIVFAALAACYFVFRSCCFDLNSTLAKSLLDLDNDKAPETKPLEEADDFDYAISEVEELLMKIPADERLEFVKKIKTLVSDSTENKMNPYMTNLPRSLHRTVALITQEFVLADKQERADLFAAVTPLLEGETAADSKMMIIKAMKKVHPSSRVEVSKRFLNLIAPFAKGYAKELMIEDLAKMEPAQYEAILKVAPSLFARDYFDRCSLVSILVCVSAEQIESFSNDVQAIIQDRKGTTASAKSLLYAIIDLMPNERLDFAKAVDPLIKDHSGSGDIGDVIKVFKEIDSAERQEISEAAELLIKNRKHLAEADYYGYYASEVIKIIAEEPAGERMNFSKKMEGLLDGVTSGEKMMDVLNSN